MKQKGIEYFNGKIIFEGEYLNGKKWNGNGYDNHNNILYTLKDGNGYVKNQYPDGTLNFEGEYINGDRNGKGKEYNFKGIRESSQKAKMDKINKYKQLQKEKEEVNIKVHDQNQKKMQKIK